VSNDAQVTLIGNLTREPELRFTQGGKEVCSFGMAVNRRYQVNGEWQEKVSFFNVTVWDTAGENCAASLAKGMRVIVTGRLEQNDWEDKEGNKRSSVEVVADEVGPSLRWARAEVEKIVSERTNTNATRTAPANDPVYGDEEPF